MLTDIQLKSVEVASSSEPTPELASFWQQKYRELYVDKIFFLDQATEDLIKATHPVKKFRPPRGYVNLPMHILNGKLDEEKLEKTVEIAIRYLDDIINKLQLAETAQKVAFNYRAIKISIQGLEIYLDKVQPLSSNEEITKIASCIAVSSYRASESLAEEKGACQAWKKYNKPHKINSYDMLYNVVTDEQKVYSEFENAVTLEGSDWEIYQRRNLSLLDFPKNSSWEEWDDYTEEPLRQKNTEPRKPFRAVEVNVENTDISTVSQTLHASPYKKLFNALLDNKEEQKQSVQENPTKQVPVSKSSVAASVEEKNELLPSTAKPNSMLHLVITLGEGSKQAGVFSVRSGDTEADLSAICQNISSVKILHAFHTNGLSHFIYLTKIGNLKKPVKMEFKPVHTLSIEGREIANYIQNKAEPTQTSQAIIQNNLVLNSHIEEYQLQTTYYGRVSFTVEYINGLLGGISGNLEKNDSQTNLVFNFLSDTLKFITRENSSIEAVIKDLEIKKNSAQNKKALKPLILATHILKIIQSKQIR